MVSKKKEKWARIVFVTLVMLVTKAGFSQTSDSLIFAKGRYATSLFGSLTSQTINISSSESVTTVGYTIGSNSGVFIDNNFVLGINFSISRYEYNNGLFALDAENLQIGLWSRYYFAVKESSSLYVELIPFYSGIYNETEVYNNSGAALTYEIVKGGGFGVQPGVGFTYILNRNIGFGLTLHYSLAKINTEIEDRVLGTKFDNYYYVNQLGFDFNFQVYLDQFFF